MHCSKYVRSIQTSKDRLLITYHRLAVGNVAEVCKISRYLEFCEKVTLSSEWLLTRVVKFVFEFLRAIDYQPGES